MPMKNGTGILLVSVQTDLSIIGLKYVHYYLLENGWRSHLLHLPLFDADDLRALENLRRFVCQVDPLFIGVSLMSVEYSRAREVSRYLKRRFPAVPIVWGGIHPTLSPQDCFPFADYVCIGEGEGTALDLANALNRGASPKGIPNLCYREGDRIVTNPLYPLIEDLDRLPFCEPVAANGFLQTRDGRIRRLDRRLLGRYGRYEGKLYDIITSRGCPFSCTYCCNSFLAELYGSKKVRRRSVANVIGELENAVAKYPGLEEVNFQDDSFMSHGSDYLRDFCEQYRRRVNRPFVVRAIPAYVTRDKLRILAEAGLSWISIGLQSGSDRVLRETYGRTSLKRDFLEAAEMVNELELAAFYDVILDNPLERDEDRLETVNALIETPKPFFLQIFSLSLYCGTELYERAKAECPERIQDAREKDYLEYEPTTLNTMTRLAAYLPGTLMRKIVSLYEHHPRGIWFGGVLAVARILNGFLFEPFACCRVLKRSAGGSNRRAFGKIRVYLREVLKRYAVQFK